MQRYVEDVDFINGTGRFLAGPRVGYYHGDFSLSESELYLQNRRWRIAKVFALNADAPASVLHYLREAYYFVPLHRPGASKRRSLSGRSDCFRTIYDYEAQIGPPSERNIYYGLQLDAKLPDIPLFQQADGWLLDPLNPQTIAATRRLAYTRFTIMSLVRCLLDFADSEFTQETAESLARARTLYLTALDLLNLPELQQRLDICDKLIIEPGKISSACMAVSATQEELTRTAVVERPGSCWGRERSPWGRRLG